MADLFPKPPRRMKQPTKAFLRAQLATAAEQIEQLQRALCEPWWRRWARRALSPLILAAASWWPRKPKEASDVRD